MPKKLSSKMKKLFYYSIHGLLVFVFLLALHFSYHNARDALKKNVLNVATAMQAGLERDLVKALRADISDEKSESYYTVRVILQNIAKSSRNIRYVYLYKIVNNIVYYAADSEPSSSNKHASPGIVSEVPRDVRDIFDTGQNAVLFHTTDRWGKCIRVMVPVKDLASGKVIAVFGLSYAPQTWSGLIYSSFVHSLVLYLCILLALLFIFQMLVRSHLISEEHKKLANLNKDFIRIQHRLAQAQQIAHAGDWSIFHSSGEIIASPEVYRMHGLDPAGEPYSLSDFQSLVLKHDSFRVNAAFHRLIHQGTPIDIEYGIRKADTEEARTVHAIAVLQNDDPNDPKQIVGMIQDITERAVAANALKESERAKTTLLSNLIGMAYRCDYSDQYRMQFVSEGCLELTGYAAEMLTREAKNYSSLICAQHRDNVWQAVLHAIRAKAEYRLEYEILTANGETKWVLEKGQPVFDDNGSPVALEGFIIDITDRKKREEDMLYLSRHDQLTGLHNRTYYAQTIAQMKDQLPLPLSVIIGDVNGLKLINDTFGHAMGDQMLVKIAQIIKRNCSGDQMAFRIGGDEFCLLLPHTDSAAAEKILRAIVEACKTAAPQSDKLLLHLSISCGHATATTRGHSVNRLVKKAEEVMYKQKLLESKSIHSSILSSIRSTMHEKSLETQEHADRMCQLSQQLGRALHLRDEQLFELELLANLHDLGKMSIDDRILNKPGPLNEDEWNEMHKHPAAGYRIARSSPELLPIAEYILAHHERWDGNGYPQGLSGYNIPLLSRIISIIDSYDAMTQDRPYRLAMSKQKAVEEIKRGAGSQFDPAIAYVFINLLSQDELR